MKKFELVLSYMLIGSLAGFLASLPFAMTLGYSGLDLEPWIVGGIILGASFGTFGTFRLGYGLPGARLLSNRIGRYGLWGSVIGTVLGGVVAILLGMSLLSWLFAIIGLNAGLMLGHRREAAQEETAKQTQ